MAIFALILGVALCLGALGFKALLPNQEILIESLESKTKEGNPVFNKIRWLSFHKKDIWLMSQSHHGFIHDQDSSKWDHLAIIVDKKDVPPTARFLQLQTRSPDGKDIVTNAYKEKPFRVSCFLCHTNGPRAIRPVANSLQAPLRLRDHINIFLLNLRIKSYGRVSPHSSHEREDHSLVPPFRRKSPRENETLKVRSCTKCHQESGLIARGYLRRQNAVTIQFMLQNKFMPPLGFSISKDDENILRRFLLGF